MAWEFLEITIGPEPPAGLPGEGVGEVTQTDAVPTLWGPVVPRPPTYGEDLVFIENEWQTIDGVFAAAGGGRWNQQLIVVGKDVIYFEEIT